MKCRCGETDPEKFAVNRTSKSGKQSSCKKCQAQRAKDLRRKNFAANLENPELGASAAARVNAALAILKGEEDFDIDVEEPDFVLTDADILAEQSAYGGLNKRWGEMHSPRLKRIAFIPDVHAPYHDKRAWRLVLQVLRAWKPVIIVDEGDFVDCYSVSSHDKRPDRVRLLDEEIASANELLTELDSLGATEKYFVAGNHEDRLERYLTQKAPELFNMVKIRDLLKLDERGWKYVPYKQSLKIGKLNVTHDCGNAGAQAHAKALSTFQHCIVIGHTHRMAVAYEGNAAGESHVGGMFGWLGDVSKIDYLHQIQALRAWQLGFGVGWMEESGVVHIAPIPIVNYRCVLEGKLYVG